MIKKSLIFVCLTYLSIILVACASQLVKREPDIYGCYQPIQYLEGADVDVSVDGFFFRNIQIGSVDFKYNPRVISQATEFAQNNDVVNYEMCIAKNRFNYNKEQLDHLRKMILYLSLKPTTEQFLKWQELYPFPGESFKKSEVLEKLQHITNILQTMKVPTKQKISDEIKKMNERFVNLSSEVEDLERAIITEKPINGPGNIDEIYAKQQLIIDKLEKLLIDLTSYYSKTDREKKVLPTREGITKPNSSTPSIPEKSDDEQRFQSEYKPEQKVTDPSATEPVRENSQSSKYRGKSSYSDNDFPEKETESYREKEKMEEGLISKQIQKITPITPFKRWDEEAEKFVNWAVENLWSENYDSILNNLYDYGFLDSTIRKYKFGFIPDDVQYPSKSWWSQIQQNDFTSSSAPKMSSGLVIPYYSESGLEIVSILDLDNHRNCYFIPGSSKRPIVFGFGAGSIVIESLLDALLIYQEITEVKEVESLIKLIALGPIDYSDFDAGITNDLFKELSDECLILVESDKYKIKTKKVWVWWEKTFPHAKKWAICGQIDFQKAYSAGEIDLLGCIEERLKSDPNCKETLKKVSPSPPKTFRLKN